MKLNLGCGHTHNEGYINIDANEEVKPDLLLNFASMPLPYEDGSVEEVTIFHTIEHIAREQHSLVFGEINRVLPVGGVVIVSFPNAERCMENALSNESGLRYEYWERTILGRANNIWDVHRCLMFVDDFLAFLNEYGFGSFKVIREIRQPHNTVIQAVKKFNTIDRAALLRKEVIGDVTAL